MEGTLYSNLTFNDLNDLVYGNTAFNIHDTRHYFLCLFKVLSLHQPAFYEPPCSLYGRQFPFVHMGDGPGPERKRGKT